MTYNPFVKAIAAAWQELTSDDARAYYQRRAKEDRERLVAIRNELVAIAKDVKAIVDEFHKEPEIKEVECAIVGQLSPVSLAPSMVQANNKRWILQHIPVLSVPQKVLPLSQPKQKKKSKNQREMPVIRVSS